MIDHVRETVQRSITVPVPINRAFILFTTGMTEWWPSANTFGKDAYEAVVMEPQANGRWYERSKDGDTTDWGRVKVWEPPHRVVLTWQINPQGLPEPDPEKASEVEVRFIAESENSTRIELEHRDFAHHGEEGGKIWHDAMASEEGGWTHFLNLYASALSPA